MKDTHVHTEISIVSPVYRSAATLELLVHNICEVLQPTGKSFEILLVEDCGGDDSWRVIESLARAYPRVRGMKLSRNFGQHAATICGIAHARGRWIVTIDDDLEQSPSDIPRLLQKAEEGFDLVYGIYPKRNHSAWRNITSGIARRAFSAAIPSLNFDYTSFRVIDRSLAGPLSEFDSPSPFIDGYLSWLTNHYAVVPVAHSARTSGHSNYTLTKLLRHSINIFVSFSDFPLRAASWIGLATSFIGLAWLACVLAMKFVGGITVGGFTSIMVAITLFGGIQLLILGVLGEYLGRINFKSSRKPVFVVSKDTQ